MTSHEPIRRAHSNLPYLAFVETQKDCARLEYHARRLKIPKSDVLVVPLDASTEDWLTTNAWISRPLEEIVDLSLHEEKLWHTGIAMADIWFRSLPVADTFYEQAAIPDFRRFFIHALACETVLDQALNPAGISRVLLLPWDQVPIRVCSGMLPDLPPNGVFRGLSRWYCAQHSVPTLDLADSPLWEHMKHLIRPWKRITISVLKRLLQQLRLQVHLQRWWHVVSPAQAWRNSSGAAPSAPGANQPVDVMIANWGLDLHRNMRMAEVLAHTGFDGMRLLHLSNGREGLPRSLPANHIAQIYRQSPISGWRYLREFVLGVFLARWRIFQRSRQQLADQQGGFFNCPLLDFQFIQLFFEVYSTIYCERDTIHSYIRTYKPRIYIDSDIDLADARARISAARESGVTTMTTNHGLYLYAVPRSNFLADYCLVGGPALKENLIRGGVPAEKIHIIGNPSFRAVDTPRPSIVIITAAPYDLWSYQYKLRETLGAVHTLAERLSKNSQWDVIIKSHPISDFYTDYNDVVQRLGRDNLQHISKSWSREEFRKVSVAICLGTLSGAMLELQSYGVPIVYLDAVTGKSMQYDYQGCGEVVPTVDAVGASVARLIVDAPYRRLVTDRGRAFFQRYTNIPDNSLDRFSTFLHSHLQTNGPAVH